MPSLIAAVELAPAEALAAALGEAGLATCGACECRNLVRDVVRLAPETVVVLAEALNDELVSALKLLGQTAPRPLLLIGPAHLPQDAALLQSLLAPGVQAWLPSAPADRSTVGDALQWAQLRFERTQQLQQDLDAAHTRLDERKWVDRAKGVLMQHQQLSEEQAFAVLRTASMHANLRLGEVSRGLLEAAQAAEAVNRAGQLRMLSQRLVKAMALRALDVERHRADEWLDDTLQRVRSALEMLAGVALMPLAAQRLQTVQLAWPSLEAQVLAGDAGQHLDRIDSLAEHLLEAADALTTALEQASARPHLHVVNMCGRQRMLSQRLAKQALLSGQLTGEAADAQAAAAVKAVQGFEQALVWLEQAPLSTPEIRAALARARGQWQRMLDAVRRAAAGVEPHEAARHVARESEALLASFDELTTLYQHSMQGLLA